MMPISSDANRFEDEFASLLARLGETREHPAPIDRYWFVRIPAGRRPWTDTGIDVTKGDRLSLFCAGRAWIAKHPQAWAEAYFALWFRIGEHAEMFRTPKGSITLTAEHSGRLYAGNVFPGEWSDAYGRMAKPSIVEDSAAGSFAALIIRWRTEPASGLREIANGTSGAAGVAAAELQRLRSPSAVPEGWGYLFSLGDAGVFRQIDSSQGAAIRCECDDDAMILQKPLDIAFTPDTRLRWSWRVESLPSARAEDTLVTHDYLSLAVEFDNGQDLTYMWSAELPPETTFRCPVASWRGRETHLVIRSGRESLGHWLEEERDLWRDYHNAIGAPPARIVGIWLIAASVFQHGQGHCEYRNIQIATPSGLEQVI